MTCAGNIRFNASATCIFLPLLASKQTLNSVIPFPPIFLQSVLVCAIWWVEPISQHAPQGPVPALSAPAVGTAGPSLPSASSSCPHYWPPSDPWPLHPSLIRSKRHAHNEASDSIHASEKSSLYFNQMKAFLEMCKTSHFVGHRLAFPMIK